MRIDAGGMHYKKLNELVRKALEDGNKDIVLDNVNGQRYIGAGLSGDCRITINGVPGNDLGIFMDGPVITVNSNGQDGIGNTMNRGMIVVSGDSGDILGHSMRGGKIYIKGKTGYRTGIHMKSYKELRPEIVIGNTAGDFLGEYMAGGIIIVLGMKKEENEPIVGNWCGTGMHGGTIYIRGDIEEYQLGKEVKKFTPDREDHAILRKHLNEYCSFFSIDIEKIFKNRFIKLIPVTHRPYGKLYAY